MAPRNPVYADIKVGMNVPALVKRPTTVSLFMFSAALWVTHRTHYDQDFVRAAGLKDVLVSGPLQASYLVQMVTDWLGENGTLRKFSYQSDRLGYPGDEFTCTGVITGKQRDARQGCLELDLSLVNQKGEKLTYGTTTVLVPLGERP